MDFEGIIPQGRDLNALRYLTLAGTVVLAYDSLLTMPEEIRLIWPAIIFVLRQRTCFKLRATNASKYRLQQEKKASRPSQLIPKLIFICMKVIMLGAAFSYIAALTSPVVKSKAWCDVVVKTVGRVDTTIEVLASGVILYRLYLLWNFSPIWSRILGASFFLVKGATFVFSNIAVNSAQVYYLPINVCAVLNMPKRSLLLSWAPAAAFDVFAFALLLVNALSRPRQESERLMTIIYRDGFIYFLATFAMRLLNVILVSVARNPAICWSGTIFSGAMVTVASTRSFLRLFHFSDPRVGSCIIECEHGQWLMGGGGTGSWCPDCSYSGNNIQIELSRVEAR